MKTRECKKSISEKVILLLASQVNLTYNALAYLRLLDLWSQITWNSESRIHINLNVSSGDQMDLHISAVVTIKF